ncbi:MAG: NAD(P)-dependent oxidoreductase [Alphaproteobacteria bacterium]|nr:NAD(P)-dependent oxidoreductase [Alphaproteobacteria bacterium]MBO4643797.1 NAD(P)-dependent oxidoreductase [Alphaproteobacteria bacterium]
MKKLLLTGGTGFIGRNILPILRDRFEVVAPPRAELNLSDETAVRSYLENGRFDVVFHCANPNPAKNALDVPDRMGIDALRAYFSLRRCSDLFGRMFYLGSGAEYDKRFEIVSVKEESIGTHLPADDYGFTKYIMNSDARSSENIYNLRIFGCYGPTDAKTKFIRDAIDCCLENRPVTIRQNCMFDYMYVEDLGHIACELAKKERLAFHDYNICSGKRISLLEIAEIVKEQMNNPYPIEIAKDGWNREYTADNSRLLTELAGFRFTPIEEGIARQITWQRSLT